MTWLVDELEQHAREVRGECSVRLGRTSMQPTARSARQDETRWRRWRDKAADAYQTYYAGGQEAVETTAPDGRVTTEKRPCMTLDAHSAWDKSIPEARRIRADGDAARGQDDEAEHLVASVVAAFLEADVHVDAVEERRGERRTREAAATDGEMRGLRELNSGIRTAVTLADMCGGWIAEVATRGMTEAGTDAATHRPGRAPMPPTNPQNDVERGLEMPEVLGRSFWKHVGGIEGYDAVENR